MSYIRVLEMKKGAINLETSDVYYDPATVPQKDKYYMPVQCHQCRQAPCTKVCPVQATWQEKDGLVYQELPMPSDHGYVAYNDDRYESGTKLPSSGHLRVTVSPDKVKVEYVRSFLPKDETKDARQGAIAHSYEVKARA